MPKIVRLTFFKIGDKDTIQEVIGLYSTLAQDATKDGKQYIQLSQASAPYEDHRNQGYNLMARCVFDSLTDMEYFDQADEVHAGIKKQLMPKFEARPLIIYSDMQ